MNYFELIAVAVIIVESSYTKGLRGKVDIVELLKSVGLRAIHRGGKGDGGVDEE
ncbi:59_t:CDS:2, partial [Cetraspora pellucida]